MQQPETPFNQDSSAGESQDGDETGANGPVNPGPERSSDNRAPVFLSRPVTGTNFDQPYFYPAQAFDPDGDTLSWSLETAPKGLNVDPQSGAIYGSKLPTGSHGVLIRVEDGNGGIEDQPYTLLVTSNPSIFSNAPNNTFTGYPYVYQVSATSPDETALIYTLVTAPSGMHIDPDSGHLEWPTPVVGEYDVVINVTSASGNSVSQGYVLTVLDAASLTIISRPETIAFEAQPYDYRVSVLSLTEADKTYTLTKGVAGMELDTATGLLSWVPTAAGTFAVEISVTDVDGRTGSQGFDIQVRSLVEMDQVFTGIIQDVFDSLNTGDIDSARTFLSAKAQANYLPVLNALLPFMQAIIADLGEMERVSISNVSAEYIIPRTMDGETRMFIMTFITDPRGEWKLHSL